jgi:hypothetical protein
MTIIALISLKTPTVEETTMVTETTVIIGIEVKVLTDRNVVLKMLLLIEIIVTTVLDHLEQIIIVHMIDLAVLIANNVITIIGKTVIIIIDKLVVETDPQIAITVETLAWIGLITL